VNSCWSSAQGILMVSPRRALPLDVSAEEIVMDNIEQHFRSLFGLKEMENSIYAV